VRGPSFTKLGEDIVCFRFRISCCIFKRGRLKAEWFTSDIEKDALFDPCEN